MPDAKPHAEGSAQQIADADPLGPLPPPDSGQASEPRQVPTTHGTSPDPLPSAGPDDVPVSEPLGSRIGPYRLFQQLGEGGMGTVYLAEQTEPVRRQVALKVIKAGMDSRQVLARFEAERQALALMDHPNIARVFDASATDGGRPFFVMELVRGIPITQFCDQERLGPRERLALFLPVCQAVQHAHQKGIIHRDLKPSNVLVALSDGQPVPKVIDFGLAKATQQRLTDRTLVTEIGALVGTLEYMAPEQAELNNLDIDTRVDIYSLGVLLYELLTGTTPFTGRELRSASFTDMLRMIREVEPPRPSTRLSSSPDLPTTAARRQVEPQRLAQLLRGDLDWIVMKCLSKERGRRYETANGLALDVQRFLADEPVLARPPSASYWLRKFVRRHRGPVVAAVVVALALVGGMIGTAIGLAKARRAEAQAKQQAINAEQAAEAERKANELLQSLFAGLDPRAVRMGVPDVHGQLIAQLDEAAAQLDRDPLAPLTQARLQHAIGQAFYGLGERKKAVALLEQSLGTRQYLLGKDHPDTLQGMHDLADVYGRAGLPDKALPLLEKTVAERRSVLGDDHPDTLQSISRLAEVYRGAGLIDRALPLLRHVLDRQKHILGEDHADTLATLGMLADTYRREGKVKQALPLYEEVLQRRAKVLGPNHPKTLESMRTLGGAFRAYGQLQQAIEWLQKALTVQKLKLGEDHPDSLYTLSGLGHAYRADRQYARALEALQICWEKQKVRLGPDHPDTTRTLHYLALVYQDMDRLDRAVPLLEEALRRREAIFGRDPDTIGTMFALAEAYRRVGKLDQAAELYKTTWEKRKALRGADHPATLAALHSLALASRGLGKPDQAVELFEKALAGRIRALGAEHRLTLATLQSLAAACEATGDLVKAEPYWVKLVDTRTKQNGADDPTVGSALMSLGSNLLRQKRYADAEVRLRACLRIRKAQQPDAWSTFQTSSLLGEALLEQRKYAEAEPLLVAGYEGLKQRREQIPATDQTRLTRAVRRLVELYKAWDRPDEVRRWQKERDALKSPPEAKR